MRPPGPGPGPGPGRAPGATTPAGGTRTTAPAPPPTTGGGLRAGTFAGGAVSEKYGKIQVTITVASGRIADVSATCTCSGESAQISGRAFAKLRQAALTAARG